MQLIAYWAGAWQPSASLSLDTDRLMLRPWTASDVDDYRALVSERDPPLARMSAATGCLQSRISGTASRPSWRRQPGRELRSYPPPPCRGRFHRILRAHYRPCPVRAVARASSVQAARRSLSPLATTRSGASMRSADAQCTASYPRKA